MTEKKINDGFIPALGTPTDDEGKLNEPSFSKQIELMLSSGAAGLLCLGSMGKMVAIRDSEYQHVAQTCVNVVSRKVPVFTGVMDCSVGRVLDRIDALGDIDIDGVVATTPFYNKLKPVQITDFFTSLSKKSRYPLYIYDLPPVTQSPVTKEIMIPLLKLKNIKGIKTANLNLILDLERNGLVRDDFEVFYSGLDSFDAVIKAGIKKNLDGMFTCTPANSKMMYEDIDNGDHEKISRHLNNILTLRNIFAKEIISSAYSYAMELLGCSGNYNRDFDAPASDTLKEEIYEWMNKINEI